MSSVVYQAAVDTSIVASVVTGIGAVFTGVIGIATLIRSGKDKNDREADRSVQKRTADKIEAEKDEIIQRTKLAAVQDIQDELNDTKQKLNEARKELEEAYARADKLRELLQEKNNQIDAQDRVIRRLTRRAEVLEEWHDSNKTRFQQLGITPLPDDFLQDRRHTPQDPPPMPPTPGNPTP